MNRQSQPYAPTDTEVYTNYTYDALGRTVTVTLPDGASKTQNVYQGNVVTVTDPAGKWKQYASDVFGNLRTVLEPDPTASPVQSPPNPPPAYPLTTAPTGMLLTSYRGRAERLKDGYYRVPKAHLITGLRLQLEMGMLQIAAKLENGPALVTELADMRVKVTVGGNEQFGAWREGTHDDLVLAVALASWGMGKAFSFPSRRDQGYCTFRVL